MDYLERNIKDSYSNKTVLIRSNQTQGSSILFAVMAVFWTIAVVAYHYM